MDRKAGFWWSPDSKRIAFTEVDTSKIPPFRIMHQGKQCVGSEAEEIHAYPFAGASNVTVSLGIVSVHSGDTTWMDLACGQNPDEEYLARVRWAHGKDHALLAQVLDRAHSRLKLLRFDPSTGKREVVLVEQHDTWVNLHDCFTPLGKERENFSGGFIWASEKTGFRHLYLHDRKGACLGPLTQGDWMVEQIAGVNETAGIIFFTGTLDGPLESHLYWVSLFPDWAFPLPAPSRLTQGKGRHVVILDHQLQRFVDVHDSVNSSPRVTLCSLQDGGVIAPLYEQSNVGQRFPPPEIVQVPIGSAILYGALYRPDAKLFGPPPYKTVVSVYGGPYVQTVCDSWINTVDMRAQFLRSQGFLVWKVRLIFYNFPGSVGSPNMIFTADGQQRHCEARNRVRGAGEAQAGGGGRGRSASRGGVAGERGPGPARGNWNIRMELRGVRGGHGNIQVPRNFQLRSLRGSGDGMGRIRLVLYGEVYGVASGEGEGIRSQLGDELRRQSQRKADAGPWDDRRKRAFSAHSQAGQRSNRGGEVL